MATSKSLRKAVKTEVKEAAREANSGNEQTIAQSPKTLQKAVDLPTGTRRDRPPA